MKRAIQLYFLLYILGGCSTNSDNETATDIAKFVNTFIGTENYGHTFPGASLPFSMLQVSPNNGWNTGNEISSYDYDKEQIVGFSHMHLNGVKNAELLDVLIMPTSRDVVNDTTGGGRLYLQSFISTFLHANEQASPGYYGAKLSQNDIFAEVTTTERSALHGYHFPKSDTATILIDLSWSLKNQMNTDAYVFVEDDSLTIVGYRFAKGLLPQKKIFFAAQFSRKIEIFQLIENGVIRQNTNEASSKFVTGAFHFGNATKEPILLKIAFSSVSEEAALNTLKSEIKDWDFQRVMKSAKEKWNKSLEKIDIRTSNIQLVTNFYSSLYRAMLSPNLYADANGQYRNSLDKIENNGNIKYHNIHFGCRNNTVFSLHNLLQPTLNEQFIQSALGFYNTNPDSTLPGWLFWGNDIEDTKPLYGAPVITATWLKNINSFNGLQALNAFNNSIERNSMLDKLYKNKAYIPSDNIKNARKITLENSYNDWAVAQLAKNLADTTVNRTHTERAEYYKNLFNKEKKLFEGKTLNGTFTSSTDTTHTVTFNSSQLRVLHDMDTLIAFMGGTKAFEEKLDKLYAPILEENKSTSFLNSLNKEDNDFYFEATYLYNKIGKPEKTQQLVRMLINNYFKPTPDGLPAADRFGNLSAWYVFSCLGFFPLEPVSGFYEIGSPIINQATIKLSKEKTLSIRVLNQSNENIYVQSVSFNNKKIDSHRISYETLISGGELVFEMTNKKVWQRNNYCTVFYFVLNNLYTYST